jgi:hypothetical protein
LKSRTAFDGQNEAQTPHPMQRSAFICAIPSTSINAAAVWHFVEQIPHPVHMSGSTTAKELVTLVIGAIIFSTALAQQHRQQLQMLVSALWKSELGW